ncbi:MAG: CHAP domain-containing protein [Acidimicrobiia bacterium]|nr:CHAP domain-containing protein [Acidimicrobiia bacterium]
MKSLSIPSFSLRSRLGLAVLVVVTLFAAVVVPVAAPSPVAAQQQQTGWYVNDNPSLRGPSRYWYAGDAGRGYGSNNFRYTYAIGGDTSTDNWASWSMGRRVGRQEIQMYVPRSKATATVTYRINIGGVEHTRRLAQKNASGWTSLGSYDADGSTVTIVVRDTDASEHHSRNGLAASRIGVDAARMRCVSRCSSTPSVTSRTPTLTVSRGSIKSGTTNSRWVVGSGSGWPAGEQFWIKCGNFVDTRRNIPVNYRSRYVNSSGRLSWGESICYSNVGHTVEVWTQSGVRKTVSIAAPAGRNTRTSTTTPPTTPPTVPPESGRVCDAVSVGVVNGSVSRSENWERGCVSSQRGNDYFAGRYRFAVGSEADVTIDLQSSDADSFLYLLDSGNRRIEQDDDGGSGNNNSRISRRLSGGTYIVEATTYSPGETGSFTVRIHASPPPTPTTNPNVVILPTPLEDVEKNDIIVNLCLRSTDNYDVNYLRQEVALMNQGVVSFYAAQSNGRAKINFVVGEIHYDNNVEEANMLSLLRNNSHPCTTMSVSEAAKGQQILTLVAVPPASDVWGFANYFGGKNNLGAYVNGYIVVPTKRRFTETGRFVGQWEALVAHEVGHSLYGMLHTNNVERNGRTYADRDPKIIGSLMNNSMARVASLADVDIFCINREIVGWACDPRRSDPFRSNDSASPVYQVAQSNDGYSQVDDTPVLYKNGSTRWNTWHWYNGHTDSGYEGSKYNYTYVMGSKNFGGQVINDRNYARWNFSGVPSGRDCAIYVYIPNSGTTATGTTATVRYDIYHGAHRNRLATIIRQQNNEGSWVRLKSSELESSVRVYASNYGPGVSPPTDRSGDPRNRIAVDAARIACPPDSPTTPEQILPSTLVQIRQAGNNHDGSLSQYYGALYDEYVGFDNADHNALCDRTDRTDAKRSEGWRRTTRYIPSSGQYVAYHFPLGECTSWVQFRILTTVHSDYEDIRRADNPLDSPFDNGYRYELSVSDPNSGPWSDAHNWAKKAMDSGVRVESSESMPRKFAIAHWNANEGYAGNRGHVAFVEHVEDGGNTIWVSEMNARERRLCYLRVQKITRSSNNWPSNFIYIE